MAQEDNGDLFYAIHCLDDLSCGMVDNGVRFGGSVKRIENYVEHKLWQGTTSDPNSPHFIKKFAAGPMESEDGKYMIGSLFIVQATREKAEAFIHDDVFFKKNVWKSISIARYISIPNGLKPAKTIMDGEDRTTLRMVAEDSA